MCVVALSLLLAGGCLGDGGGHCLNPQPDLPCNSGSPVAIGGASSSAPSGAAVAGTVGETPVPIAVGGAPTGEGSGFEGPAEGGNAGELSGVAGEAGTAGEAGAAREAGTAGEAGSENVSAPTVVR